MHIIFISFMSRILFEYQVLKRFYGKLLFLRNHYRWMLNTHLDTQVESCCYARWYMNLHFCCQWIDVKFRPMLITNCLWTRGGGGTVPNLWHVISICVKTIYFNSVCHLSKVIVPCTSTSLRRNMDASCCCSRWRTSRGKGRWWY